MPTPPAEHRFPCAQCGAALTFAPGQQRLVCDFCGHAQEIGPGPARAPARQEAGGVEADAALRADPATGRALQWDASHKAPHLAEIPLAQGLTLDQGSDLAAGVRLMACPNCGARIEAGAETDAKDCPFCATPLVAGASETRAIRAQGVLPFVVTEAQARKALDDWLGGLWFAPSGLTAYARRGRRMRGVYAPFWTFDASTESAYDGLRGDHYTVTVPATVMVDGKPRQVMRQEIRTRWTPVSGRVTRDFNDVLVLASGSLPRRITDALTPWDLAALADWRPEFLAGFEAEGYSVPLAEGHRVARAEMAGVIATDVRRAIGGDAQQVRGIETRHAAETFKHVLLPVWTAAYRYNGASYRFVVNGQSGRVQGERPWSVWKIAAAVVLALALAAAALWVADRQGWLDQGTAGPGWVIDAPGGFVVTEPGGYVIRG